jgi:hypothetical protein
MSLLVYLAYDSQNKIAISLLPYEMYRRLSTALPGTKNTGIVYGSKWYEMYRIQYWSTALRRRMCTTSFTYHAHFRRASPKNHVWQHIKLCSTSRSRHFNFIFNFIFRSISFQIGLCGRGATEHSGNDYFDCYFFMSTKLRAHRRQSISSFDSFDSRSRR